MRLPQKTSIRRLASVDRRGSPGPLMRVSEPYEFVPKYLQTCCQGPSTQGSDSEICRPHPESYQSRNRENFGGQCWSYRNVRSTNTVCLAQVAQSALGIHCIAGECAINCAERSFVR